MYPEEEEKRRLRETETDWLQPNAERGDLTRLRLFNLRLMDGKRETRNWKMRLLLSEQRRMRWHSYLQHINLPANFKIISSTNLSKLNQSWRTTKCLFKSSQNL